MNLPPPFGTAPPPFFSTRDGRCGQGSEVKGLGWVAEKGIRVVPNARAGFHSHTD